MSSPRAEPLFFGPRRRPLAGWLHRAAGHSSSGVVICNPFGYEAICAHRALRHFAERIAAAGIPALRFDYDGTGDSAGDDRDPDRLGAWVESTRAACTTLRDKCGVDRIWFLGLRLGVLVAVLAAEGLDGVSGVIAIAPVVSGRAYLRELKLLQVALGLAVRPSDVPLDTDVADDGQEAHGFGVHAETRAALAKVDLTKLAYRPGNDVLVLDRNDLPGAPAWIAHLRSQGVGVEAQQLPGYVEIRDALPHEMLSATTAWLTPRVAVLPASSEALRDSKAEDADAEFGGVSERGVFVDAARRVFGVLTAPRSATPSGRAVLLLNAGAIHHIGPNRLYVALARQWAAAGDLVLRLDITGVGDSPAYPGETEHTVYSRRALEDVGAAVAWLRQQPRVTSVWSVGLCSGAYHAVKSAVAGHEVDGIIAINPLTFFWTPDQPLDFPAYVVTQDADRYQRAALDPDKWKKVFRGEVNVRRAVETVGRRLARGMVDRFRDGARRLHLPLKDDVGVELNLLAKRGVALRFVFAAGDPGRTLLADQGGSAVTSLRKKGLLKIDEIAGADHTFTPLWSHGHLAKVLSAAFGSTPLRRR